MKLYSLFILNLILGANLLAQRNGENRLFIPYLDRESQSNIVVTISGAEQPCPLAYTNTLLNTNLFNPEEQAMIQDVFVKYENVTTNFGPPGTTYANLYQTNYTVKVMNRTIDVKNWIADFEYTNLHAQEEIVMSKGGLSAKFHRADSNDGYNMYFIHTGNGTMLRFSELKRGSLNGILAAFEDMHWQGTNWNFRNAHFTAESPLVEYRQYTNGMVFGKFLMWNPRNNNLILEAKFTEPYDFEKHRVDLMH